MTHLPTPQPILNEYLRIFDESANIELVRAPEIDRDKITAYIENIVQTVKIHMYFSQANLAAVTDTIFHTPAVRDYVLCVADRFQISIAGNEHISYVKLCQIIASIGDDGQGTDYGLSSGFLPKSVSDTMHTETKLIIGVLKANSFIMIPLLHVLNMTVDIAAPEDKSKKS